MLPVTGEISVVHLPIMRAKKVLTSLERQGRTCPLLARQIRWTVIASVDSYPGHQILAALTRYEVCVPPVGSALMIPTGLGRHTPEGVYWVNPPRRDHLLPPLSAVLTTALAVGTDSEFR